jgi:multidrug resistance efflux pump
LSQLDQITRHFFLLVRESISHRRTPPKQGVVSELDAKDKATAEQTSSSNADAFAANLRVLEQQVAFKRVTAPFAGTITGRNTNVGDLIPANNTSMEMFHIQQTNPLLRIWWSNP